MTVRTDLVISVEARHGFSRVVSRMSGTQVAYVHRDKFPAARMGEAFDLARAIREAGTRLPRVQTSGHWAPEEHDMLEHGRLQQMIDSHRRSREV